MSGFIGHETGYPAPRRILEGFFEDVQRLRGPFVCLSDDQLIGEVSVPKSHVLLS